MGRPEVAARRGMRPRDRRPPRGPIRTEAVARDAHLAGQSDRLSSEYEAIARFCNHGPAWISGSDGVAPAQAMNQERPGGAEPSRSASGRCETDEPVGVEIWFAVHPDRDGEAGCGIVARSRSSQHAPVRGTLMSDL